MIEKIFGTKTHIKVLLYLHKISSTRNRTTIKELNERLHISRPSIIKAINDLKKAHIVVVMGTTKARYILIANTPQRRALWRFINDFEKSFYQLR